MHTKIFISWSGALSQELAEHLRAWLPFVLQRAEIFFTPEDLEKGSLWGSVVVEQLQACDIGLICVTPDNLSRDWLLFEAGALALSKSETQSRVCQILFDLDPAEVNPPLAMFNQTRFSKEDFRRLVKKVNSVVPENARLDGELEVVFEKWWPDLEIKVRTTLARTSEQSRRPARATREMIEETLELTRHLAQSLENRDKHHTEPAGFIKDMSFLVEALRVLFLLNEMPCVDDLSNKAWSELWHSLTRLAKRTGDRGLELKVTNLRESVAHPRLPYATAVTTTTTPDPHLYLRNRSFKG